MNLDQINQGLLRAFEKEGHRIVMWFDPEQDFQAELGALELPDVTVLNMAGYSALAAKVKLEREDPGQKYLLYFPSEEKDPAKDWLLDIKLYSRCFYADRISILFNDLGLVNQGVREHIQQRERFFADKKRTTALLKWVRPADREPQIDIAITAVLTRADQPDLEHILFALAQEMVEADLGLEQNPASIEALERYGLLEFLVAQLHAEFGYEQDPDKPFNLGTLFIRLLISGFVESLGDVPNWAESHAFKGATSLATGRALLSRWRDSTRYYKSFDRVSSWVETALGLSTKLRELSFERLAEVETFECIEQQIIGDIVTLIPEADERELERLKGVISFRRDRHWASRHHQDDVRRKYRTVYQALTAGISLFSLKLKYAQGFHFKSCEELYGAYVDELFQFDQHYRHYWAASLKAHVNVLKDLDDKLESCYSSWFLDNLAKNWGENVEREDRIQHWRLPDIANQYDFYQGCIQPLVTSSPRQRVTVIISDAFRYEAAEELVRRINEKRYSEATLGNQLGVLPSYTTLGMASLLPHDKLEYKDSVGDDVLVDGLSTKGLAARNKVLSSANGKAVSAEELKSWSRDEGREQVKDVDVLYAYHNVVDARGDSAATEAETFLAVEQAIQELTELVRKVILNLNCATVYVTADHGFLFQQSKMAVANRTSLEEPPQNAMKSKKRYVIGANLAESSDAWRGEVKDTAGSYCATTFWIPKGANRFHFVGGARFVHGGAMPQEIVVPVVQVKALRGDKAERRTKEKVGVIATKSVLKMVNNIQQFDLLQTDPVGDNKLPITLTIGIYDGDKLVSSEEKVSFESTSDNMSERTASVRLSLAGDNFDRRKDYYMILKDADLDNVELERYRVTIDLAFTDDFF